MKIEPSPTRSRYGKRTAIFFKCETILDHYVDACISRGIEPNNNDRAAGRKIIKKALEKYNEQEIIRKIDELCEGRIRGNFYELMVLSHGDGK